jgi:hypothetical protein
MKTGDLDWERVTTRQADAVSGQYALAMSGYLQWLARSYEGKLAELRSGIAEYRATA